MDMIQNVLFGYQKLSTELWIFRILREREEEVTYELYAFMTLYLFREESYITISILKSAGHFG
jgi:hypothetical protein